MARLIFAASFSGVEIYSYPDHLPLENRNSFDISGWHMFDLSTGSAGSWYIERQEDHFYVGYVEPTTDYKGRSSFITAAVGLPRNLLTNQLDYVGLAQQINKVVTHYFNKVRQATTNGVEFGTAVEQAQADTQALQNLQPHTYQVLASVKPEYPANFRKDLFATKFDLEKSTAVSYLYPIHSEKDLVNWIAAVLFHDYESPTWSSFGYLEPIFDDRVGLYTTVASLHDRVQNAPPTPASLVYSLLNPDVFNGVRSWNPLEEQLRNLASHLEKLKEAVSIEKTRLRSLHQEQDKVATESYQLKQQIQDDLILEQEIHDRNTRLVEAAAERKVELDALVQNISDNSHLLANVKNDIVRAQDEVISLEQTKQNLLSELYPYDMTLPERFISEYNKLLEEQQNLANLEEELNQQRVQLAESRSTLDKQRQILRERVTKAEEKRDKALQDRDRFEQISRAPYQRGYADGFQVAQDQAAKAYSDLNNQLKKLESQLPRPSKTFLQNFAFGLLMTLMFLIVVFAFFKWL